MWPRPAARSSAWTGASISTAPGSSWTACAIQGNLDPLTLLGPPRAIEERVADIISRAGGRPGHIFNLGHGLVPQTPPDNVKYLVDAVHRLSAAPI